jgi:hypothetical protein
LFIGWDLDWKLCRSFNWLNLLVLVTIYLEGKTWTWNFSAPFNYTVGMKLTLITIIVSLFGYLICKFKITKYCELEIFLDPFPTYFDWVNRVFVLIEVSRLVCLWWPCQLLPHLRVWCHIEEWIWDLSQMVAALDFRKKEIVLYYSWVICPTLVRWNNKYWGLWYIKQEFILFANHTFLGLLAKIKCSICSYQFHIWYVSQWSTRY